MRALLVALEHLYNSILYTGNPFAGDLVPGPGWEKEAEELGLLEVEGESWSGMPYEPDEKKPSEEGKGEFVCPCGCGCTSPGVIGGKYVKDDFG